MLNGTVKFLTSIWLYLCGRRVDASVHFRISKREGSQDLNEGQTVSYDVQETSRGLRPMWLLSNRKGWLLSFPAFLVFYSWLK